VHEWHDKVADGNHNISPWRARIIGKFLRAIITHCDTTKQEIIQAFSLKEDKVFMIPHGNYIGYYKNQISRLDARKILGVPAENFIFLLLGYIYRYKGVLEAIDSFQNLQQEEISLVIAGKTDEEQLQEMIREKIKDYPNILFVPGRVPEDEIQIYMNACDCVVLPYKVFTSSGVALLAMSFGRACIAPNVGFFSDVLDESRAILYDSTYEEGLLEAMKCAIEKKKDILEMGKYNLKLAEQWNWNYVADETFKIYQWCLGR
jgi:glycosyltransferase involved in cell wall biosynthesis